MENQLRSGLHHVHISKAALKRVWQHLHVRGTLSPEARDRLAMLAGFQSWTDFEAALHGSSDVEL